MGLEPTPLQSPWLPDRTGMSGEELVREVRLLRPDGALINGPEVYRFIMRRTWWLYPAYLVSLVPGARSLFDWGYRSFARHRSLISAVCGLPDRHDSAAEAGKPR